MVNTEGNISHFLLRWRLKRSLRCMSEITENSFASSRLNITQRHKKREREDAIEQSLEVPLIPGH